LVSAPVVDNRGKLLGRLTVDEVLDFIRERNETEALNAALVGIPVPLGLRKLGRDPVLGSSVLLTFTTDGMGFFIFLGLATVFLL
jgi:Mg/Co/Ni transporter MgtE